MFIRGAGRYLGDVVDLAQEELLHAAFVRSILPHASIVAIDLDTAVRQPEVIAVITSKDLGYLTVPGQLRSNMVPVDGMDRPVLAHGRVRYVGEAIAMVIAQSPAAAVDAVDLVSVEYQDRPAVVNPWEAVSDEVLLFPESGSNVVDRKSFGQELSPASTYDIDVTLEVSNQRIAPVPLEGLGIVSVPHVDGISVVCGHQSPHQLRTDLGTVLEMPTDLIRVIVPDTGGAFGLKGAMYPEYAAVVKASLLLNAPITWRERRREHFLGGTHGRGQHHTIRISGDHSGRIRRLEVKLVADLGAYPSSGSFIPLTTLSCTQGPYDIEHIFATSVSVVTNTAPIGSYRGAGRPEAIYALENAIDAFARAGRLDPVQVRRKNLISPSELPFLTITGARYDGGDYGAALERLAGMIDIPAIRRRQCQTEWSDRRRLGLGICMFVEPAGGPAESGEYGKVALAGDGSIDVFCGSTSSGQGHGTMLRSIVHDRFGIPGDRVRVMVGDTSTITSGVGTFGSRSTQSGMVAVHRAAKIMERRCRHAAADILEAAVDDLVIDIDGYAVRGLPGTAVTFREIAGYLLSSGGELDAEEFYVPGAQTFPYGAYGAVVEIDMEVGEVTVAQLCAVDDCGHVMNAPGVVGQVLGGAAQGLGQALYEMVEYDEHGQLLTASLADYRLPTAVEMPPILTDTLLTPTDVNDLGVRGIGEAGTIGVPAALGLAVGDAMGTAAPAMPFRPNRIWEAIAGATEREHWMVEVSES